MVLGMRYGRRLLASVALTVVVATGCFGDDPTGTVSPAELEVDDDVDAGSEDPKGSLDDDLVD